MDYQRNHTSTGSGQSKKKVQRKFKIQQQPFSEGSFGSVYAGVDLQTREKVVMKICKEIEMNRVETSIMKALNNSGYKNFPQMILADTFKQGPGMIIQRFGRTLDEVLIQQQTQFSDKTVFQIGIQLVDLLEEFHSIGCVHNDLKLDNICVGLPNHSDRQDQLKLIDFGIASPYTKNKRLIKDSQVELNVSQHAEEKYQTFKGNYAFCSPNALNNISTSRRDDFFSLLYILIFLKSMKIPFMDDNIDTPEKQALFKKEKIQQKPIQFCTQMSCLSLLEFANEIYNYEFKEKPNYKKLKFLLTKQILNLDKIPDKVFDWNKHIFRKIAPSQISQVSDSEFIAPCEILSSLQNKLQIKQKCNMFENEPTSAEFIDIYDETHTLYREENVHTKMKAYENHVQSSNIN